MVMSIGPLSGKEVVLTRTRLGAMQEEAGTSMASCEEGKMLQRPSQPWNTLF